ncbi:MAG: tetratricopeptide repeat protein [Phycisphaerae bacterium]
MTPQQFKRGEELFQAARRLDPTERAAYLRRASADDETLRARVEAMLAEHDRPPDFLRTPIIEKGELLKDMVPRPADIDGAHPPQSVGGYTIVRKIGEGGMGVVYEAVQENPQRTVALKLLRPGFTSDSLLHRFRYEAQVLGQLHHPGIAHVYEAGVADGGSDQGATRASLGPQPFFAMEYICGEALNEYAEHGKLDTRRRLELVAKICDAVQHAHQKGVIHRDLKPQNILVDETGQPKVLDFGVARATDADMRTVTMQTNVGQLVGTLAYMSPEQVLGDSRQLDTRSDVYSLGVILYELVTDRLPQDVRNHSIPEAVRLIREEEPSRLSSIDRRFRGDVDTIAAKALEKDKDRRYQSAAEFAADIRRYLRDEPIAARPASATYQLRKFAKRNKALVAGAVVVFVVLVAGIVAERRQRVAAEKARAEAVISREESEAVTDFLVNMLAWADPEKTLGRDITIGEVFDIATKRVETEFRDQPRIEAAVRAMLGHTYINLGDYIAAQEQLTSALQIQKRELGNEHPNTLTTMNNQATLLSHQGDPSQAERLYRLVLEARRRVLGEDHPDTLKVMNDLATALPQGKQAEAESLFRRAIQTQRRKLGEDHPDTLITMRNLGSLLMSQGKLVEAEELFRHVLKLRGRVLSEQHPETLRSMDDLATLLRDQGKLDEAEPLCRQAMEGRRLVLGEQHPVTLRSLNGLAHLLQLQGKLSEAEPLCRQSVDGLRGVLGEEHPQTLTAISLLSLVLMDQGKFDEAEPVTRRLLQSSRRVMGEEHRYTLEAMNNVAAILKARGKFDEAEPFSRQALETARRILGEEHNTTLVLLNNQAGLLRRQGKPSQAEPLYRQLLKIRRRILDEEHPDTLTAMNNLSAALRDQGKLDESEQWAKMALDGARRELSPGHALTSLFQVNYAKCLTPLQRYDEAEALLLEAYAELKAAFGAHHKYTRRACGALVNLYEAWNRPEKAAEWRQELRSE